MASFEECCRYTELGNYGKAVEGFQYLLQQAPSDLRIVKRLLQTLMAQGYTKRAFDVLSESVIDSVDTRHPQPLSLLQAAIHMYKCLLEHIVTMSFDKLFETARYIIETIPKDVEGADSIGDAVDAEICYCQLVLQGVELHKPIDVDAVEIAKDMLEPRFEACFAASLFQEAYRLAAQYWKCVPSFEGLKLLQKLNDPATTVATANARLELVNASMALGIECRYHDLLLEAKEIYLHEGHCHGGLDVDLALACSRVGSDQSGEVDQGAAISNFQDLREQYERMDFPWGLTRCLSKQIASTRSPSMFNEQIRLLGKMKELSGITGENVISVACRVDIADRLLARAADYGSILADMKSLWVELSNTDCHYFAGRAARLCSAIHSIRRDGRQASEWAERCSTKYDYCLPRDKLDAMAVDQRAKHLLLDHTDVAKVESLLNDEVTSINQDILACRWDSAAEKMELLLNNTISDRSTALNPTDPRLQCLMDGIERLLPLLEDSQAFRRRINLAFCQMRLALAEAATKKTCDPEHRGISAMAQALELCDKNGEMRESIKILLNGAPLFDSILDKDPSEINFKKSYDCWKSAQDKCQKLNIPGYMNRASHGLARCVYHARRYEIGKRFVTPEWVLQHLVMTRKLCNEERSELSILGGLEAIETKRSVSFQFILRDTIQMAMGICMAAQKHGELWEWVQEAKARSVSDLMGLGILIPQRLRQRIQGDSTLKSLLEQEVTLTRALRQQDGQTDRLGTKLMLDQLRDRMRTHEVFQELLSLREGQPVTLREAQKIALAEVGKNTGVSRSIVFVDWFTCGKEIYMMILKGAGEPELFCTGRLISDVLEWKKQYLDTDDARDKVLQPADPKLSALRQMDFLVQPLDGICEREDILVLSPTGPIHSIPLHALWIREKEELIDSNPVVYCASLTTFVHCVRKTADHEPQNEVCQRTVVAVYEPSKQTTFRAAEQHAIYRWADDLARDYDLVALKGPEIKREDFIDALSHACWLHFHGHCLFDQSSSTDQCLLLSEDRVSVTDLFEILLNSPHVTLVACESASQSIAAGDEPLGLVTALLCAGASSVVGTIWPTPSGVGRRFSSSFYEKLSSSVENGVVNLAIAVREAVLDIKWDSKTRHPYYWASFVIHGSWTYNAGGWTRSKRCD